MERTTKHFRKRDAILTCLRSTDCHPGADWIYAQLKPQIPDLSLGTVYRNLAYFKDNGQIVSVGTVLGVERFDGNTEPHVHFICTSCGAIHDLHQIGVPQQLSDDAATFTGGYISGCNLSFTGLCGRCKNQN